jgi:hypothetical protein
MRAGNATMEQTFTMKLDELEERTSTEIRVVKESVDGIESRIAMLENVVENNEETLQRVSESRRATLGATVRPTARPDARNSLLFSTIEPSTRLEANASAIRTVAVTQIEVKESDKLQTLSLKGFIYIRDIYTQRMKCSPGDPKRLVDFFTHSVLVELVNSEQLKKTELSKLLNHNNIYDLADDDLKLVVARKLRPLNPERYIKEMYYSTTKFRSAIKGWVFQVKDYYEALYPAVNKLIEEIQDIDAFFRLQASAEELQNLPLLNYGRVLSPGVFRIAMQSFGRFKNNFISLVTEDKLRLLTTMPDFVKAIKKENDYMAQQSIQFLQASHRMDTPMKLEDIYQEVQDAKDAKRRSLVNPMHAAAKTPAANNGGFNLVDSSCQEYEELDWVEENPLNESPLAAYHDQRFVYPSDDEEDETGSTVAEVKRFENGNAPREKTYKDKPKDRVLPCFEMFRDGKCQAGSACVYSHDEAVLRTHGAGSVWDVYNSPFVDKTLFARAPPQRKSAAGLQQDKTTGRTPLKSTNAPPRRLYVLSDTNASQDPVPARKPSVIYG